MSGSDPFLEPGVIVRHPAEPDWGLGQVQSVAGAKVTVNFEEAGKQVIDARVVTLVFVRGDPTFTVTIARTEHGQPVAGAVNAPATGETWFTQNGQAMKRIQGGATRPVRARDWPQGAAIALVSHTMKPETIQALAEKYGF